MANNPPSDHRSNPRKRGNSETRDKRSNPYKLGIDKQMQSLNLNAGTSTSRSNPMLSANAEIDDTLKCPCCKKLIEQPIFMCESGHDTCHVCRLANQDKCPICQGPITKQRNFALERIAAKVHVKCPNYTYGCQFISDRVIVAKHEEKCQYHAFFCPIFKYDASCDWKGSISLLHEHFLLQHGQFMTLKHGTPVTFKHVDIKPGDRNIQLFLYENFMFLYHVKINKETQTANWAIQYVGDDNLAKTWQYEIHVYIATEPWRKIMVYDHCIPYSADIDEVLSSCQCAAIPLKVMKYYCSNAGDFTFKFYLKNKSDFFAQKRRF